MTGVRRTYIVEVLDLAGTPSWSQFQMSDPLVPTRRYGDKEIGALLKRATELQQDEPSIAPGSGMTLAELEEIAAEAGIDPRFLRRAAVELDTDLADASIWVDVVGEELMLVRETQVAGELGDGGFERVVTAIQRGSREHGQPSLLGRSLTWRAETPSKTRTAQITVTSTGGVTDIRLEESLHQLASGIFGGTIAGFGGSLGLGFGIGYGLEVLGSALFATAFPLGLIGLSFIASREIYRRVVKRRRRAVNALFDQVVAEVTACVAENALSPADAPRELPPG